MIYSYRNVWTDNRRISEKTVENTLELTKYLMKKYGIDSDHVVRHYYASRKDCPSAFHDNNWAR
ncbi:MAG: N-acetylmuramoyl-L-alanine amidase [Paeniclostridium sordellii]|nr:N-acetylmuramoyl-L-alanine amidase [Paeniclostridium sordellii]